MQYSFFQESIEDEEKTASKSQKFVEVHKLHPRTSHTNTHYDMDINVSASPNFKCKNCEFNEIKIKPLHSILCY